MTDPAATEILAVPPVTVLAVNVAVYVVPLPEKLLRIPRPAVMSLAVNPLTTSLHVNVIVEVPPATTDDGDAEIVRVGGAESIVTELLDAFDTLPAASTEYARYVPSISPVAASGVSVLIATSVS